MTRTSDLFIQKETLEQQMVNGLNMPVMTKAEAIKDGLMFFWTGNPCEKGHFSKRRVKGGACQACVTIQSQIYKKDRSEAAKLRRAEKRDQRAAYTIGYNDQQKVLEVLAKTGDLQQAAKSVNKTLPQLNVQMAKVESFRVAVYNLEKRLKVALENDHYRPIADLWDQDKRDLFITAYIDTGDIQSAREAIKVSASIYHKELERNSEFAKAIKEAKPKADLALEERAIQLALKGNDKLLTLILKAKLPEYKDKLQIEQNTTVRLSDAQIETKIIGLFSKYKDIIEGEVVDNGSIENDVGGKDGTPFEPRRIGSEEEVQQIGIYVPSDRETVKVQISEAS